MESRRPSFLPPRWPYRVNWRSPQADHLVYWWPGEPAGGGLLYELLQRADGTLHLAGDNTDWPSNAALGTSMLSFPGYLSDFNGTSKYVSVSLAATLTGPWTVTCWARPTATGFDRALWGEETGTTNHTSLAGTGTDAIGLQLYNVSGYAPVTPDGSFVAGQLYHVAVTYTSPSALSPRVRIYLNGAQVATDVRPNATLAASMGFGNGKGYHGFEGQMRDWRIYNAELSPWVIAQMAAPATRWDLYAPMGVEVPSLLLNLRPPLPSPLAKAVTPELGLTLLEMGQAGREVLFDANMQILDDSAAVAGLPTEVVSGTSVDLAPNRRYIMDNGNLVVGTLPVRASVGTVIHVLGKGSGRWKVAQRAGQQIRFGRFSTTVGTGGALEAVHRYRTVTLVCMQANRTWEVVAFE